MIVGRAAGPGPRTVAQQQRPSAAGPGFVAAVCLMAAILVAACGSAGPTGSAGPGASSGPGASPGASSGPGGSIGPNATPPRWPGTTVLATIALGAADGEIQKAGIDLAAAADKEDLKAMWGAADGLAKMIDGLTPNIARLEIYPETQAAAAIYRKAFPELAAGAKQLRDAITAGDANGIVAGSQQIQQGLADYAPVRQVIAGLVEQAIVQQRLYLQ